MEFHLHHFCPQCGGTSFRRSHRRSLFERLIYYVFLVVPVRCEHCNVRYYAIPRTRLERGQSVQVISIHSQKAA